MLLFKSHIESNSSVSFTPSKKTPQINERQEFAKEMATYQLSQTSQQLQNKEVSVYAKNESFLAQAKEVLLLQRMGVNKESVDELRARLEQLNELLASGKITEEAYQEQKALIEEQMSEAFRKSNKLREEDALETLENSHKDDML